MDKTGKKSRNNSKNSDTSEKSSKREKDDFSKEGGNKEKEGIKDETSDEDEVVNYPNQPPIQNGFVVFIHQLNLATTAKEKRTVVEWISDALKTLDISPETITVDKMMEQSIATCSKPKVPIIKFSRPVVKKHNEDPESNGPSFRFRTKNRKTTDNEELTSETGSPAKPTKTANTKGSQSRKKIKNDKSKTGNIAPGVTGQNSAYQGSKGTKLVPQKSVNSSSSKGLQRKSGRPVKPQIIEDKKQEFGVQLNVLRDKCRTLQRENNKFVWVLLIESRKRCIVDMGKLNSLASKFRFKVRWIPAQAPRSLDHAVFAVVNDIVQTKNICFPEQMKGTRRKDKEAKQDGKLKQMRQIAKAPHVEILHKTLSAQFDVSSYASIEIAQFIDVSNTSIANSVPVNGNEENLNDQYYDALKEKQHKFKKTQMEKDVDNEDNLNEIATTSKVNSNESVTSNSSESSSSLGTRNNRNKSYAPIQNTVFQLALITGNNPFTVQQQREETDTLGLKEFFTPTPDYFNTEDATCKITDDSMHTKNKGERSNNSVVVVIREPIKVCDSLTATLKNMLLTDSIDSCTLAVSSLLTEPTKFQSLEDFSSNDSDGQGFFQNKNVDCKLLIQSCLDKKLKENKFEVIIIDVEDESIVKMGPICQYALKIGFKTLILERQSDGSFETNLKKVMYTIRRRFKQRRVVDTVLRKRIATICLSNGQVSIPTTEKVERRNSIKTTNSNSRSISCMVNSHKLKYSIRTRRASTNYMSSSKRASLTNVCQCQLSKPSRVEKSFSWTVLLGVEAQENINNQNVSFSDTILKNQNEATKVEKDNVVEHDSAVLKQCYDTCCNRNQVSELEPIRNSISIYTRKGSSVPCMTVECPHNEKYITMKTKKSQSFHILQNTDLIECKPPKNINESIATFLPSSFSAVVVSRGYGREPTEMVNVVGTIQDSSAEELSNESKLSIFKFIPEIVPCYHSKYFKDSLDIETEYKLSGEEIKELKINLSQPISNFNLSQQQYSLEAEKESIPSTEKVVMGVSPYPSTSLTNSSNVSQKKYSNNSLQRKNEYNCPSEPIEQLKTDPSSTVSNFSNVLQKKCSNDSQEKKHEYDCCNEKIKQLSSSPSLTVTSFTSVSDDNFFEKNRSRKRDEAAVSAVAISSTSGEELKSEQISLSSTQLHKRILKKGFFHKTKSRLTGFFRRVCNCGRKIHQIPKKCTNPNNLLVVDSFIRRRVRRLRLKKPNSCLQDTQ